MRYDIRHFRRPVCAFPGCGNEYDGDEAEWWSDPYWAFDQAWEDDWLVLDGTHCGKPTVDGSRWCAGHVDMWTCGTTATRGGTISSACGVRSGSHTRRPACLSD